MNKRRKGKKMNNIKTYFENLEEQIEAASGDNDKDALINLSDEAYEVEKKIKMIRGISSQLSIKADDSDFDSKADDDLEHFEATASVMQKLCSKYISGIEDEENEAEQFGSDAEQLESEYNSSRGVS